MSDMDKVIVPKSDQMNADDLIGGPRTIKVTGVKFVSSEQPISVHYEGDNGKPWKPCKSSARVMVRVWGNDSKTYVGKSLTLYRDEKVKWGGMAVGGIRISHMSHIDEPITMALTESKGSRKPFTVKPLVIGEDPEIAVLKAAGAVEAKTGMAALETWFKTLTNQQRAKVKDNLAGWKEAAGKVAQTGQTINPPAETPISDFERIRNDMVSSPDIESLNAVWCGGEAGPYEDELRAMGPKDWNDLRALYDELISKMAGGK